MPEDEEMSEESNNDGWTLGLIPLETVESRDDTMDDEARIGSENKDKCEDSDDEAEKRNSIRTRNQCRLFVFVCLLVCLFVLALLLTGGDGSGRQMSIGPQSLAILLLLETVYPACNNVLLSFRRDR